MTTQPENIKPNGPDEITSLVIMKTMIEHHLADLHTMADDAFNAGRPMSARVGFLNHQLLRKMADLVQASIDNDFDSMNDVFGSVGLLSAYLEHDEQVMREEQLHDALALMCPDNPTLTHMIFLKCMKMFEDAQSGGLRMSN